MGGGGSGSCGLQGRCLRSAKCNFEGNLLEVCFMCICVDLKADCIHAHEYCMCMRESEGVVCHFVRRFSVPILIKVTVGRSRILKCKVQD